MVTALESQDPGVTGVDVALPWKTLGQRNPLPPDVVGVMLVKAATREEPLDLTSPIGYSYRFN